MTIPTCLQHLVFEVSDFGSPEFCDQIIGRARKIGFGAATITTERGTSVAQEIRNNDRVIFDDAELANALWRKAESLFLDPFKGHRAVGLNERFRVYRYGADQFFDWHQDGEFKASSGHRSMFTMVIYLNEGCEGGDTSFADVFSPYVFDDFTIAPKTGKALFFYHPLSHRGDLVISGEKFILRTDVIFEKAA
ncbi:iron-regulated protein [Ruegeria sp. ANG-R]|uniref:prolyl hydroxylase family protein n=1 Tax=Ruegeria sp. ANG-R TaxID=1577903 RepID=UPI0005803A23|nr:2OG-Fe(II) oxygenase [Ruegeria sp. ANG-R]KIC36101.1 iron-regulated protein [Ruegeria sp. ANG-R]